MQPLQLLYQCIFHKISHSINYTFTGICLVSIGLGSPRVIGLMTDEQLQYQRLVKVGMCTHLWYRYWSKRVLTVVSTGLNGWWNSKSIIVLLCSCTKSSWSLIHPCRFLWARLYKQSSHFCLCGMQLFAWIPVSCSHSRPRPISRSLVFQLPLKDL